MKSINLDITKAAQFLSEDAVKAYGPKVKVAQEALEAGTCPGNDFLGWLHLPSSITPAFLDEVQAVANTLREKCEVVVVAGIGGSYLGARAVIEALGNSFAWLINDKKNPTIMFAGNNIGAGAGSPLLGIGHGHNHVFGYLFAHLCLALFFKQTECEGSLGGGSRLADVDNTELFVFQIGVEGMVGS